jgi:hypothetical protein
MTPSTEPETIEACLIFTAGMRGTDIYISLSDEALRRSANYRERISVWSQATRNLNSWRRLSLKGKQRMRYSSVAVSSATRVAFRFCFVYFGLYCLLAQIVTEEHHTKQLFHHSSSIIFAGFSRCRDEIF